MKADEDRDDADASAAYTPIVPGRQFRILELLPAPRFSDDLVCQLIHAELENPPTFEALSYVWGDSATEIPSVVIAGRRICITKNLDSALRSLRRVDATRTLWVDALCIAQYDVEERSKHVKCMKEVYAACYEDILWIGDDDSVITKARTAMRELGSLAEVDRNIWKWIRSGTYNVKTRNAIGDLFWVPGVWKRAWIMQEVSFAPQVVLMAGQATMSWDEVETFLDTEYWTQRFGIPDAFHAPFSHELSLRTHFGSSVVYPFILAHQRRAARGDAGGYGASLLDVLARFRYVEATDPRDMIYGLLGLTKDTLNLQSDYGLSIRQTYIDCSRCIIEHYDNLDLICQGPWELLGNEDRSPDMPSWCPDYAHPGKSRILFAQRDIYAAGTGKLGGPLPLTSSGSLILDGLAIDTLATLRDGDAWRRVQGRPYTPGERTLLAWMPDSLLQQAIDNGNYSLTKFLKGEEKHDHDAQSASRFEDYWRTLMVDSKRKPWRRLQKADIDDLGGVFDAWRATSVDEKPVRRETIAGEEFCLEVEVIDFSDVGNLNAWHDGWCFAISSTGLYCMVPPVAEKGDHIAVLPGAKVPVLLRPCNAEGSRFVWVGACYVHGFMDGQALGPDAPGVVARRYEVV